MSCNPLFPMFITYDGLLDTLAGMRLFEITLDKRFYDLLMHQKCLIGARKIELVRSPI